MRLEESCQVGLASTAARSGCRAPPSQATQVDWDGRAVEGATSGHRLCHDREAASPRSALLQEAPISLAAPTEEVLSFGPFSLIASERLLTKDGAQVDLGARALDILIALASRPNETISKADLLARVWPDVIVEEGSLRFHMASLRRALGDGKDGARFITTLTGRGYCFVAPLSRAAKPSGFDRPPALFLPSANLPNRASWIVGRTAEVSTLTEQLVEFRLVTIVGAGGVGKTTVAIEVAHESLAAFAGAVMFVDLGLIGDPALVATAVASTLGLSVQSEDPMPGLEAFLRSKRMLLLLDTCEHLIEAVAVLAARLVAVAPDVHILATSREALQVEGERIHRLDPLAYPAESGEVTAAVVQKFPATRLFVERAVASGAKLDLSGADAAIVVEICRQLDGVALAIELAARRVEAYGLGQIALHLDRRLALLWAGTRGGPPRHKTLRATLEWSYGLLSETERTVLRRLAVFVGGFTIEAALAVVTDHAVGQAAVFSAVDSLVSKSMIAARPVGAMMRYRLLDTTRAYTLEVGADDLDGGQVAARHASYYREWLRQVAIVPQTFSSSAERTDRLVALNNVRAALEWCFGVGGDVGIGIELATAAVPAFLAMSLLPECDRWSRGALRELTESDIAGPEEMQLQAALGVSLMFTRGGEEPARVALDRSLAIAETRGDTFEELQVLGPLQMLHLRRGDFKKALHYARRCSAAAGILDNTTATIMARSLLGTSLHLCGDQPGARLELEAALRHEHLLERTTTVYMGFECSILARGLLARSLWMLGDYRRAAEQARRAVRDAAEMGHPLTLSISLIWAISVFLLNGDLESAETHIDWQVSCADSHSLAPHLAVGRAFSAELAIRRGRANSGVAELEACLRTLHAAPYALLTTPFKLTLVEALATAGRPEEGFALLNRTIHEVDVNGDVCYVPELLRVKGRLLLAQSSLSGDAAEEYFLQALEMSRRQSARAWELRTCADLARLWIERGRSDRARAILRPIVDWHNDGDRPRISRQPKSS